MLEISVSKPRQIIGAKFGRLAVIRPTAERSKNGHILYECDCECGEKVLAIGERLLSGYKKSCGCLQIENREIHSMALVRQRVDLSGAVFGFWTVVGFAGHGGGGKRQKIQYRCRCACGAEKVVFANALRQGHSRSCGCKSTELRLSAIRGQVNAKK